MQDAIAKLDSTHPGLKEQYEVAIRRFQPDKPGSPGSEFISYPGFLSGPSEYHFVYVTLHTDQNIKTLRSLARDMRVFSLP